MDFQKNLPVLSITTNDVYYKRQLTVWMLKYTFCQKMIRIFMHTIKSVANKGSDEVASFLFNFVMTILDPKVKELDIFCDSCGGQNKTGRFSGWWTI